MRRRERLHQLEQRYWQLQLAVERLQLDVRDIARQRQAAVDLADGGSFVTADEKRTLSERGTTFSIVGIQLSKALYGERYTLFIVLDGAPRRLGLAKGTVPARDRVMAGIEDHFAVYPARPLRGSLYGHGRHYHVVEED
jgi:hypothetical protein